MSSPTHYFCTQTSMNWWQEYKAKCACIFQGKILSWLWQKLLASSNFLRATCHYTDEPTEAQPREQRWFTPRAVSQGRRLAPKTLRPGDQWPGDLRNCRKQERRRQTLAHLHCLLAPIARPGQTREAKIPFCWPAPRGIWSGRPHPEPGTLNLWL